ncbi:MAG: metal-sensing transcriptional repressor [Spirochaetia bacterium]|nr:metal-sensing transcriptional repressor [Spirochaetia bacterium]
MKAEAEVQALIHRLSRAQGQLESVKKKLAAGEAPDCKQTVQQLKAAHRAITEFAQAYVLHYFEECITGSETPPDRKVEKGLREAIAAAFTL